MIGLFLIGILIVLFSKLWLFLLIGLVLLVLWWLVIAPAREAREREARDRLRHEHARREIDRIATETTRAMYAAAHESGDVIEGTAVEVTL
jgi:predicted cobalt transporter CbtA